MCNKSILSILLVPIFALCLCWDSSTYCQESLLNNEAIAKTIAIIEEIRMGNEEHVPEIIKIGTEVVPILIPYLEDANPTVREDVIIVLGQIRDKQAITGITDRLNDSDSNVRRRAIDALSKYDPDILAKTSRKVVPSLIKYLQRNDENSYKAALIIGNIGDKSVINELKVTLKEVKTKKKANGMESMIDKKMEDANLKALAKLNDSDALSEIFAALKSKNVSIRLAAIEKIVYIGRKDMVKYIVIFLDDKENAINVAVSGAEYYLRVVDVVVNILCELFYPNFPFEIKKDMRYTDEEIEAVKQWYQSR
jgi:HEAT repeat protein